MHHEYKNKQQLILEKQNKKNYAFETKTRKDKLKYDFAAITEPYFDRPTFPNGVSFINQKSPFWNQVVSGRSFYFTCNYIVVFVVKHHLNLCPKKIQGSPKEYFFKINCYSPPPIHNLHEFVKIILTRGDGIIYFVIYECKILLLFFIIYLCILMFPLSFWRFKSQCIHFLNQIIIEYSFQDTFRYSVTKSASFFKCRPASYLHACTEYSLDKYNI